MWADTHNEVVHIVSRDSDLRDTCAQHCRLRHFDEISELRHYVNQDNEIVARLQQGGFEEKVLDFVERNFRNFTFILELNPHAELDDVRVLNVATDGNAYAVRVADKQVTVEARLAVIYTAAFKYIDLRRTPAPKDTDELLPTRVVEEHTTTVPVRFTYSVDDDNRPDIFDISFLEDTIIVQEGRPIDAD